MDTVPSRWDIYIYICLIGSQFQVLLSCSFDQNQNHTLILFIFCSYYHAILSSIHPYSFTHPYTLTHSLIHTASLIYSSIHPYSFTHPYILTHLLIHTPSLIYSSINPYSFTHPNTFTYSLIHTPSLIYSSIHPYTLTLNCCINVIYTPFLILNYYIFTPFLYSRLLYII